MQFSDMATNEIASFCDICLSRDLNKLAEEYCPQCEEALCVDCRHHHKISRSTKSHQTISVDKFNKLPSFIKQIKHNCEEHDFVLEFYCKSHDSLCCKICSISCHKECTEIIVVEDFLTPSKGHQSVALDNIEKVLKDMESNISSAIKDRNRNLTELREQKQKISEQIKEKRQEINTGLDNLEQALLKKVSAIEKEYCRKIEKVIAKLEDEKKKVDEIQVDVDSVKMFASNLQIYIGSKSFQQRVSINETNVQKLNDNGSFNNFMLKCTFNDKLDRLIKEIQTFGELEIDNREKHVDLTWKGDKSAQILKSKLIENINVRLLRKMIIDGNDLAGCVIADDGNMIFLQEHKNSIMKYASNGEFHSKWHINSAPKNIGYGLAVVDSNTVAVSTGGNYPHKIFLIDMNSMETRQCFDLDDFGFGLCYYDGSLICCTFQKGIQIYLKQNLTYLQTLPNAPKDTNEGHVASNENCIFYSNLCDHSVVCYNFCGQVKWIYSSSLLRGPQGITLDSHSNIYVAGSESNNIVVISTDGKKAKELIGAKDGILKPHAIYFDKTKNLLLVANYDRVAFLFDTCMYN